MKKIIKTESGTYIPLDMITFVAVRQEPISFPRTENKYNIIIKTPDGTSHTFYQKAESVDVAHEIIEDMFVGCDIVKVELKEKKKTKPVESEDPEVFVMLKQREDMNSENPIEIQAVDIPVPMTKEEQEKVDEVVSEIATKVKAKRKSTKKKEDK